MAQDTYFEPNTSDRMPKAPETPASGPYPRGEGYAEQHGATVTRPIVKADAEGITIGPRKVDDGYTVTVAMDHKTGELKTRTEPIVGPRFGGNGKAKACGHGVSYSSPCKDCESIQFGEPTVLAMTPETTEGVPVTGDVKIDMSLVDRPAMLRDPLPERCGEMVGDEFHLAIKKLRDGFMDGWVPSLEVVKAMTELLALAGSGRVCNCNMCSLARAKFAHAVLSPQGT